MKYNPNLFKNEKYFEDDSIYSRELIENERWFMGAEDRLEYFFKNEYNTFKKGTQNPYDIIDQQTRFWKTVGGEVPRIHSGLPKLATNAIVTLLTYAPYNVVINPNEEGKGNKEQLDRLDKILKDNNFNKLQKKGFATNSWAGHFSWKISHDKTITKYPILEVVTPKAYDVCAKRGRIKTYTFRTIEKQNDKELVEVREKWSLENNKVNVEYKAYLVTKEGKEEEVTLPDKYKDFATTYDIDFIPALLVNNTAYNSRFPNSIYGESDYTGNQGLFHMLDDLLSQAEMEVSNARALMFVNDKLFEKDDKNTNRGFDRNKILQSVASSEIELNDFDVKKLVALLQAEIRVEKYEKLISDTYARILVNMRLSPSTLGLPNFESINASDKTQREREKSTLRRRKETLDDMSEYHAKLFEMLLKYDDWLNNKSIGEYDITVTFDDYAVPTLDEQIDTIVKGIQGRAMDIRTGVKKLYPDLTDDEITSMVQAIKLETGTSLLEVDVNEEIS